METTTEMSPSIGALATALAAAQGEITGALKDSKNPFFKSSYADLASCWDACRAPLSKNKLAVIQTTSDSQEGVVVVTTLAHASGEWMRGTLRMVPTKNDPQGIGSCITYARRYALAAIVGLAQIDDDANSASGKDAANDPKGDGYKLVDQEKRDGFVKRMMSAYNADKEEAQIADDVYAVHLDLIKDTDMYNAVWSQIAAKDRKALKAYIDLAKAAAGKAA